TRDGGLAVLYSDVTEIKLSETARREQALAQKSHLLQRAVDNLSQGVAMVGADGVLELWNRRFLELCGLAPIAGHRAFAEVMAESELPLLTPRSQDSQGSPLSAREQRLFDGRVLEIRTHALPTGGFVNTFTDITERYRHAEALRASERWIRLITDQVPALIAYLSDELVYEFTNKVYEEWYRWPSGSMLGRCLRDVHGAEHCRRLEPYFERALAGESVTFEIAETALSGEERYMQRSYVPNRQADGRVAGLFVLIRDITERRRTAEALHQAYQNLEQRVRERTAELTTLNDQFKREIHERSQVEARLREAKEQADAASAAKSSFLANMSHEIRTPMNAVLGMLQLARQTDLNERQRDYLDKASSAATSLLGLLNDILDYSKIEAGKLVLEMLPFELEPLMQDLAVVLSGNQGDKDVEVIFDIDPELPSAVVGDRLRLQQILINLAGNALKFTARGHVLVSLRRLAHDAHLVRLRVLVADTGIGISAEQQQRIFEGFTQAEASTSRRFGGTGLGLFICKRLVDLMGGELRVESAPGSGSRFWFDLDLDVAHDQPLRAACPGAGE
ncbi:PAS domain-containing protein, partial [Pseudomonas aeruginosa]|nr:PAS domain-containing protein [Pseudomonas aeruginosa]